MIIALRVPEADQSELESLASDLGESPEVSHVEPFDGDSLAQLFVLASSGAVPIIMQWIRSRAHARKFFKVVMNGVEYSGYTMKEVEGIRAALTAAEDDGQ